MRIKTRLQEIRKTRGFSAADLAGRVGVTRQTIYCIEDGSFVPNTAVSLKLARTLQVTVEELFSTEPAKSQKASLKSLRSLTNAGNRLLLAGCDPALSFVSEALRPSGIEIVTVPCSSRRALAWLKQGKIDAAGAHLVDRSTGEYNLPIIRRLFPPAAIRVVTFAAWEQGLLVRRGNPKTIRSVADLGRRGVTLMNREKGSGSRDLLDAALRDAAIPLQRVNGYDSIASGHLPAAYAVAAGAADCCIAPRSAARCFGLDFLPIATERFDLAFTQASLDLPAAKALLDLLNGSQLRGKLHTLAGYDTAHTGKLQL